MPSKEHWFSTLPPLPTILNPLRLDITHLTPKGFAIPALEGGNCKCRKGRGLGGGQGKQRDKEFLKQARPLSSFRVEEITRTNKILAVSWKM